MICPAMGRIAVSAANGERISWMKGLTRDSGQSSRMATSSQPKQIAVLPTCLRKNLRRGIIRRIAMEAMRLASIRKL